MFCALMVKRLRRRPLTAESGVRFSLGVPKNNQAIFGLVVFYSRLEINFSSDAFDGLSLTGIVHRSASVGALPLSPPRANKSEPSEMFAFFILNYELVVYKHLAT